jgi:hypothetical protein
MFQAAVIAILGAVGLVVGHAGSDVSACPPSSSYYVDPQTGSDSACGTSPATAWKTLARVNSAPLTPGSVVSFAGGEHADGETLRPRSGVTYRSFGNGQAILGSSSADAIVLCGVRDVRIENLDLNGGSDATNPWVGVFSSERCAPSSDVTITRDRIENWLEGVQAGYADSAWEITGATVEHTGGSGILFDRRDGERNQGGRAMSVLDSTISNTGEHPPGGYAVHGIYDNAVDSRIIGNTIMGFQTDGISIRFHDAVVADNYIAGGADGIGAFEYDSVGGVTHLTGNRISRITASGVFVCGPAENCPESLERFVISGNVVQRGDAPALNLQPTAGGYEVSNNQIH